MNNIRMIRESRNMTRVELAERSGICYGMIYRLETGTRDLSTCMVKTLLAIAAALDLSDPLLLLGGDEDG